MHYLMAMAGQWSRCAEYAHGFRVAIVLCAGALQQRQTQSTCEVEVAVQDARNGGSTQPSGST